MHVVGAHQISILLSRGEVKLHTQSTGTLKEACVMRMHTQKLPCWKNNSLNTKNACKEKEQYLQQKLESSNT